MAIGRDELRALPKVDLHRHFEGSLRAETLWELHRANGQALHASADALKEAVTIPPGETPGLAAFLARFNGLRFYYGPPTIWERLAAEAVDDAADDGVVHLELRFSPAFAARRCVPVPPPLTEPDPPELVEATAESVVRGARSAAARRGISVAFIISLGRHFSPAVNAPAAALLNRPIGKELAGLDVAGPEAAPARPFAEFFSAWKDAGRSLTIHAGEDCDGPGAANVTEAIDEWKADRIGHGVRAIEDTSLVARLARMGTVLELCPTSNVQTRACSGWHAHPLKRLLDAGVNVTINSDDPSISQIALTDDYVAAHERLGLSGADLRGCAETAARAAFLPENEKRALVERVRGGWKHIG